MKGLARPLAAVVVLVSLCLGGAAEANGRAGPSPPSLYAPGWRAGAPAVAARFAWRTSGDLARSGGDLARSGADLVAEAARYLGEGKFTSLPGAWCADAVSFWLERTGRPPLPNRMAASALRYGPRGFGAPGELVVMRTRREYAGHVGIVERMLPDGSVEIISGNWGRRVARAIVPRAMVTAFIAVR